MNYPPDQSKTPPSAGEFFFVQNYHREDSGLGPLTGENNN